MGVSVVVWLDTPDSRKQDHAAFEAHGLAVCTLEDLGCTDSSERFSLQTIGRFVEVCRHARGPVAVCGDDRLACALLTAYMLRSGLFADASEAVAWISIARGGARVPDYALLACQPADNSLGRAAHSTMDAAIESEDGPGADGREPSSMGGAGAELELMELSPTEVRAAGPWGAGSSAVSELVRSALG